jgi:hypothetical protein
MAVILMRMRGWAHHDRGAGQHVSAEPPYQPPTTSSTTPGSRVSSRMFLATGHREQKRRRPAAPLAIAGVMGVNLNLYADDKHSEVSSGASPIVNDHSWRTDSVCVSIGICVRRGEEGS